MKKTKILIILLIILIIISTPVFFLLKKEAEIKQSENNYQHNENTDNNSLNPVVENEGLTYNQNTDFVIKNDNGTIIDKNNNKAIYDPQKDYTEDYLYYKNIEEEIPVTKNLNEIIFKNEDNNYPFLNEYLKFVFWLFPERSFDHFTNEEMGAIIALAAPLFVPRTEGEVQLIAKTYFGIDDFNLPVGDYSIENYGDFTIIKENGFYIMSEIRNKKQLENFPFFNQIKVDGNKIELFGDYAPDLMVMGKGCYDKENPKNECIIGYHKVYLTYKEKSLTIDKIEYTRNDKYQK